MSCMGCSVWRFPILIYVLLVLLSASCPNNNNNNISAMGARCVPPSAPSTIVRPLGVGVEYETVKPDQLNRKRLVFRGSEVKSCLPKGFRRSSAPSRFVNYHTSAGCSSTTDSTNPP